MTHWNVVMCCPPLTITREELDEAIALLDDALSVADEFCSFGRSPRFAAWGEIDPRSGLTRVLADRYCLLFGPSPTSTLVCPASTRPDQVNPRRSTMSAKRSRVTTTGRRSGASAARRRLSTSSTGSSLTGLSRPACRASRRISPRWCSPTNASASTASRSALREPGGARPRDQHLSDDARRGARR